MRVLTKSRFKLGLECPNKLYYTRKERYANKKCDDPFLKALAQGGFQVEEMARMQFLGGVLIEMDNDKYEALWERTKELLQQENVTIYEAAFLYDGLFIRTDVLVKKGNKIELIEVKSKSFDPNDDYTFIGKKGGIVKSWVPYLFDVAFQKYVMQLCFPEWKITSYIMMADKTKTASIDGLNQLFRITEKAGKRTGIKTLVSTKEELGDSVLSRANITGIIRDIINNKYHHFPKSSFKETLFWMKELYEKDIYAHAPTSYAACRDCEFRATPEEEEKGIRSGYKECFEKQHKWTNIEFEKPKTFEIWNFNKGGKLFEQGYYFMDELSMDLIGYEESASTLSRTERQWLQIEKEVQGDGEIYVDIEALRKEINSFKYPLHFIDFETSCVALPFNKGRKPYEQVGFQFSHHKYHKDGTIEHASEYINNKAGYFPNFEFSRELKKALENDHGSIFRFSNHENTILNAIFLQLLESDEPDKDELMAFIQTITHSKKDSAIKWEGERDMIDLCALVKDYYYNPLTKGSNSIKAVLPAVLGKSEFLQNKYAQKLKDINISSKNFSGDHVWLRIENNEVINPYKMLPHVFEEWSEEEIENTLSEIKDIDNGGAALTAYGKLQYTDMTDSERKELSGALLKYCELDTLAMVMIYEHFVEDLV